MLFFNQRRRLAMQFEAWCKANGILYCAQCMVGFLQGEGLLDEEKVMEYLKKVVDPTELTSGLWKFGLEEKT